MLEAARKFHAKAFINTDTLLPSEINDYSLSKHQFSKWLRKKSGDVKVVNLMLELIYGPKDDVSKFVPWLICQLHQSAPRIPLTHGEQFRDFVYIDDVVSAYLLALESLDNLAAYTDFEVGTGQSIKVREFVMELRSCYEAMNSGCSTELGFGDIAVRDGEIHSFAVDNASLERLGWQAQVTPDIGIAKTLDSVVHLTHPCVK